LSLSGAKFKLIMSGNSFADLTSLLVFPTGSWKLFYKNQREELLDHIVNKTIRGVVFISGDLQFGTISTVEPVPSRKSGDPIIEWGRYNISEIAVGPSGTRIRPEVIFNSRTGLSSSGQFRSLIDTWSFTRSRCIVYYRKRSLLTYFAGFEANPVDGTLTMEFINDIGTIVANRTLEMYLPLDQNA